MVLRGRNGYGGVALAVTFLRPDLNDNFRLECCWTVLCRGSSTGCRGSSTRCRGSTSSNLIAWSAGGDRTAGEWRRVGIACGSRCVILCSANFRIRAGPSMAAASLAKERVVVCRSMAIRTDVDLFLDSTHGDSLLLTCATIMRYIETGLVYSL